MAVKTVKDSAGQERPIKLGSKLGVRHFCPRIGSVCACQGKTMRANQHTETGTCGSSEWRQTFGREELIQVVTRGHLYMTYYIQDQVQNLALTCWQM